MDYKSIRTKVQTSFFAWGMVYKNEDLKGAPRHLGSLKNVPQ